MSLRSPCLTGILAATMLIPLAACDDYGDRPARYHGPPPGQPYYADQYYRDGPRYRERRLHRGDTIYRGRDDRYYCRRSDGTTGLIVGGLAGGVLGNIIAPGGSKTLGTILGGAGGAVIGQSVDKNDVRCR